MAEKLNADLNIIQRSGIEITVDPITADLNIIQKLDDEPNDVGGLSAAELKAKFDEAGNIIKEFINGSLIPQVVGADAVEQVREENEAARVAAETAREQAEAARAAAETEREENETARVAAETARETAFADAQEERAAAFDEAQAYRAAVFSAGEEARNFWDDYDPTKDYVPGNKVYYLGSSYVNKVPCRDVLPTVEDNWQMIAKKGADSDEGLSQEEADLRYLQLSGGRMTGAVEVLEPEKGAQPATKHYTDTCDASTLSAAKLYADGKVGQYGYSKEETLTVETAALYGEDGNAVPDDIFKKISEKFSAVDDSTIGLLWGSGLTQFLGTKRPDRYNDILFANGMFLVPGQYSVNNVYFPCICRSENGETWELLDTMADMGFNNADFLAYNGSRYVVAGRKYGSPTTWHIVSSPDLVNWDTATIEPADDISSVEGLCACGSRFFACISRENMSGLYSAISDDNGQTWSVRPDPGIQSGNFVNIVYGNGVMVAGCNRSTDLGETWELIPDLIKTLFYPQKAAFGNGVFVLLGYYSNSSTVYNPYYSTDNGQTWVMSDFSVNKASNIAFGYGKFAAVGEKCIVYSYDGRTWGDAASSATSFSSVAMAFGNNRGIIIPSSALMSESSRVYVSTGLVQSTLQIGAETAAISAAIERGLNL